MKRGQIIVRPFSAGLSVLSAAMALAACGVEKRDVGPTPPASPPSSADDPRQSLYASNTYELGEGGRMFRWYGCDQCHTDPAPGFLHLADNHWRHGGSVPEIYRSIADGVLGMPAYAGRITPQQTWQIAGYVHRMRELKTSVRLRSAAAQKGEPSGSSWAGPIP